LNTTHFSFRLILLGAVLFTTASASFAQGFRSKKSDLPDSSHFYMARQEWQYVDDSPIKTHTGDGGGSQQTNQPPGANSSPPPRILPRSGFQSYTPTMPVMNTALPKTPNGVPPKAYPKKGPTGAQANAGKLGAGKPNASAGANNGPPKVEAYAPYKGFNAAAGVGADSSKSKSNVQGNVLHWAHSH